MNLKNYAIAVALVLTMLLSGCIQDDRTECRYPLELSFSYTEHRDGHDHLREEVEALRLYLYDAATGELRDMRTINVADLDTIDNSMEWMVRPGNYKVVAWGGEHSGRYIFKDDNRLDKAQLFIDNVDGNIPHKSEQLWHGSIMDVTVDGDWRPAYHCPMRRVTNNITVRTYGLKSEQYDNVLVQLSARHATYTFDGVPRSDNATSFYIPDYKTTVIDEKDVGEFKFTTMRVYRNDETRLHVTYYPKGIPEGGAEPAPGNEPQEVYNGSLSALIDRNPEVSFDYDFDFDIKVDLQEHADKYVSFKIYINNWLVIWSDNVLE